MNRYKPLVGAILLSITSQTYSAETNLAPIVVTATRTPQSISKSLGQVTVITRDDIARSQSNTLMELLQSHTTGLDVARNGGPGGTTGIFLRGAESDHVLILVDGIRVSSAIDGTFNWASISPNQIERIEVVRGPNSTLYGSDAIGGVIQIFTRKGDKHHADLMIGSYSSRSIGIGSGGGVGSGSYRIHLQHQNEDGFSATNNKSGDYEPDNDSFRRNSLTAGFSFPLGSMAVTDLNLFYSDQKSEYDSSFSPDATNDIVNSGADLSLELQSSDNWLQKFSLKESIVKNSGSFSSKSTRRGFDWQNDYQLTENNFIVAGFEYQSDTGESPNQYDESTSSKAVYLQDQWRGNNLDILLSIRGDSHSEYGTHTTGRFTVGPNFGKSRVYLTVASAFKAPTILDLFYPGFSNPDLKPEQSKSLELGYQHAGLNVSIYQTYITDLIAYSFAQSKPINVGEASLQGLELSYNKAVGDWAFNSGVTLQSAEDTDTEESLLRRAKQKLFVTATGVLSEKTKITVETNYTGPRYDEYYDTSSFTTKRVKLNGYTLINIAGEYQFKPDWSLNARIENLLDAEYEHVYGYNTAGTSAYLTLSYSK